MKHHPECPNFAGDCCPWMAKRLPSGVCNCQCDCHRLAAAYRRGYNDGVTSKAHADWLFTNQHGGGENP